MRADIALKNRGNIFLPAVFNSVCFLMIDIVLFSDNISGRCLFTVLNGFALCFDVIEDWFLYSSHVAVSSVEASLRGWEGEAL